MRKWALSILPPPGDQIVLLPTGPGSPKYLERGPIEHYSFAGGRFFPDQKKIMFAGNEPGHAFRCYVQDVDGGKPRAFTPEGVLLCRVSPLGAVLAVTEDFKAMLYAPGSVESGDTKPPKMVPFQTGDFPIAWSSDGRFLYVAEKAFFGRTHVLPQDIVRLDVNSGRRQFWKRVVLPESGAMMKTEGVVLTPDTRFYAYTYSRHVSDLYVVQGVR